MLGNISSKTINDFASLIDIVKNADAYSDLILELKKQFDSIKNERLKLTKAKELDQLINEYRIKSETANQTIEDAKTEARKIIDEAKESALKEVNQAQSEVKNIYEDAKRMRHESQKVNSESEYLKTESIALQSQAQELMDNAIRLGIENKRVKQELEEKREALERAIKM